MNVRLSMDSMTVSAKDFPCLYDSVLQAEDVEMKLARVDITTFDFLEFFVFRRDCDTPTVSALPVKPKEMTAAGRLMYKWFAGPLREARFYIEREFGVALDWAEVDDRNSMLYESAAPLARLYTPLVRLLRSLCHLSTLTEHCTHTHTHSQLKIDDTFILQEYFIPKENFGVFMADLKEIVLNKLSKVPPLRARYDSYYPLSLSLLVSLIDDRSLGDVDHVAQYQRAIREAGQGLCAALRSLPGGHVCVCVLLPHSEVIGGR